MINLKPCPFCGESNGSLLAFGPVGATKEIRERKQATTCLSCGAEGPAVDRVDGLFTAAADAWNKREPQGAAPELREAASLILVDYSTGGEDLSKSVDRVLALLPANGVSAPKAQPTIVDPMTLTGLAQPGYPNGYFIEIDKDGNACATIPTDYRDQLVGPVTPTLPTPIELAAREYVEAYRAAEGRRFKNNEYRTWVIAIRRKCDAYIALERAVDAGPVDLEAIADLGHLLDFLDAKRAELLDGCENPGRLEEVIESVRRLRASTPSTQAPAAFASDVLALDEFMATKHATPLERLAWARVRALVGAPHG